MAKCSTRPLLILIARRCRRPPSPVPWSTRGASGRASPSSAGPGSTNADLAQVVRDGARQGAVVIAEAQFAGRGRLGRVWSAPPRSGLTFSVLLRPDPPPLKQGWLPLLVGLAVASAVRNVAEVDVRLKWPNDLLIGERKTARGCSPSGWTAR